MSIQYTFRFSFINCLFFSFYFYPFHFIFFLKGKHQKLMALLLLIQTPALYWGGKLVSPEFPVACLTLISAILYINRGNKHQITHLSFLIFGISTGFKLTSLPIIIAFMSIISTKRYLIKTIRNSSFPQLH